MGSIDDETKETLAAIKEEANNNDTSRGLDIKMASFQKCYEKIKEKLGTFILDYQLPEVFEC